MGSGCCDFFGAVTRCGVGRLTSAGSRTKYSQARILPLLQALCGGGSVRRKGPPYKIESGAPGQQPPAYVQSIQSGKVTLGGDVGSLGLGNEASFEGCAVVDGNEELAALMCDLNEKGAAFAYDYKASISPSQFMATLQEKGIVVGSYKEISWSGPQSWHLTVYEMEEGA